MIDFGTLLDKWHQDKIDRAIGKKPKQADKPTVPQYTLCDGCSNSRLTNRLVEIDGRDGLFCWACKEALEERHRAIARPSYKLAMRIWQDPGTAMEMADNMDMAYMEGRLHQDLADLMGLETGQHECDVCGMRCWTVAEAAACCYPAIPCVPDSRGGMTW